MRDYNFRLTASASIWIAAESEDEARRIVHGVIDGGCAITLTENGDPDEQIEGDAIITDVTLDGPSSQATTQSTQEAEDTFNDLLLAYAKAVIAQYKWDSMAPVGMTKRQAAKEARLHAATEKAADALWSFVASIAKLDKETTA